MKPSSLLGGLLCTLVATAVLLAGAAPAMATDKLDLLVGLKTLPLLNDRISGATVLAIIFDPAQKDSTAEANDIKSLIEAGIEAPSGIKITARLVPVSDLGQLSGAKIGFVTRDSCSAGVAAAAAANGLLTMSTDIDCVRAGRCILGIVSKPGVQIYYSRAAADAAKIGFVQAFSMLVKQV